MPKISDEFRALDDVGWYTAGYLLTASTFQLAYGKLYSVFSVKIVFLAAIALFEVGSIICSAAPNSSALIVGRAVAGVGAAGIFPGSTLVLVHSAPLEKRPALLGLMTGTFGIASLVGPFLGGVFADGPTWRWCFIINIPIGLVTVVVVLLFVRTPINAAYASWSLLQKVKHIRIPELTVVIASLVCLVLALQWGGSIYPWSDGRVIALLVVFGVLFLGFVGSQVIFPKSATIPVTIVKRRSVCFSALFAMTTSGAMFVAVTYLPIYFQAVKGASAVKSGVMLLPLILGFFVMSILSGILTSAVGYYNPSMILGPILASVGAGLLSTFGVDTPSKEWIGYQVLLGLGIGFCLQQPLIVVQAILPETDVSFGVALMNLSQMLGGAIFVSISQNQLQSRLVSGVSAALPQLDAAALLHEGATEFLHLLSDSDRATVLPVYAKALSTTFMIAAGLSAAAMVGALGTEWKSTKQKTEKTEKPSS